MIGDSFPMNNDSSLNKEILLKSYESESTIAPPPGYLTHTCTLDVPLLLVIIGYKFIIN